MRQIIPITPACLNFCTRSAPFKIHSLPSGAASFKSLYPKRPANDHATADCSAVGASDTALRLPGSNPMKATSTVCRLFAQVDFRREMRPTAFLDPRAFRVPITAGSP